MKIEEDLPAPTLQLSRLRRRRISLRLRRNFILLASGSIETLRQRTVADQTSMLLILGFAETSNASEPIALRDGEVPGMMRGQSPEARNFGCKL